MGEVTDSRRALYGVPSRFVLVSREFYCYNVNDKFHLISLEGIDSDSISDFMSSPVSINSKVLYDVENYGSGMKMCIRDRCRISAKRERSTHSTSS